MSEINKDEPTDSEGRLHVPEDAYQYAMFIASLKDYFEAEIVLFKGAIQKEPNPFHQKALEIVLDYQESRLHDIKEAYEEHMKKLGLNPS